MSILTFYFSLPSYFVTRQPWSCPARPRDLIIQGLGELSGTPSRSELIWQPPRPPRRWAVFSTEFLSYRLDGPFLFAQTYLVPLSSRYPPTEMFRERVPRRGILYKPNSPPYHPHRRTFRRIVLIHISASISTRPSSRSPRLPLSPTQCRY